MEDTDPLRPKGKGKGIMVSGFRTPGGPLNAPDNILDDKVSRALGEITSVLEIRNIIYVIYLMARE
jgi:hypothetical protein